MDYEEYFIPKVEKEKYISKSIFYHETNSWPLMPYVFPDGQSFEEKHSRVYFIERNTREDN